MPAISKLSVRPIVPIAAGACIVVMTCAAVQAQDAAGFFEMLFGAPRSYRPPVQVRPDPDGYGAGRARGSRRSSGAPKARYAALPKPDLATQNGITRKQPVDQKAIQADPGGAILKDPTLRPGDIVMMPHGPMVFRGGRADHHRASDFEDVKSSHQIDKSTRRRLLAMMVPMGALPADEARKVTAAKRRLAPQSDIDAAEAEARADAKPRVIVPWASGTEPTD